MYYLESKHAYNRFAISVKRKIGNAVERNFIKRKMKEVFRLNQHLFMKKNDVWMVIKKGFDRENCLEAEKLFLKSIHNINLTVNQHKSK